MSKSLGYVGLWTLPKTKEQLLKQTNSSQLINSLWKYHKGNSSTSKDTLNAPTTLPPPIKPKNEIYRDIQVANTNKSGLGLKAKQLFGYGKALVTFYKLGVKNVWNNHKQYQQLKNNQYMINNQVDSKGNQVAFKVSSRKLTHEMAQMIYMNGIENKQYNDNRDNDTGVTKHDDSNYNQELDQGIFKLTRCEYQLIRRTPKDFYKLPLFVVIFAIFMEFTPLLCYIFPEITPLTCVLPSISPRLWNPENHKILKQITQNQLQDTSSSSSPESVAIKTAYNLSSPQVKYLCKSLALTSRYIPISIYPESLLRDRLQNHYNYLIVDNYYLSGLNNNGNIWNLSYQELIVACLERNLIMDLTKEATHFDKVKDEAERRVLEQENMNRLRAKLFRFIVDMPQYNVGYLCLNELLSPIEYKHLCEWHTNEHYHI